MRRSVKLDLQRPLDAASPAGKKRRRYPDPATHGLGGRGRGRSCRGAAVSPSITIINHLFLPLMSDSFTPAGDGDSVQQFVYRRRIRNLRRDVQQEHSRAAGDVRTQSTF